ncbi:hypothetical protein SAMD00023353_1601300 [Rosellinia necatrix]|uniref:Uncharacterized protein n=1 Tax=Rosellinia necatrix TaxID=77044 RepID=A0A1W2TIA4_ROSNE|nr:hypothetical protein SAMD00023353_1601300 [Rosellinia necatrix]
MQFLKPLLLGGLLCLQALGATVPSLDRRDIAPLPAVRTYVDINEARREHSGYALWTDGLKTCIAVVARDRAPRASQEYDKILAHVASKLCTDTEGPGMDDQINNIFALYDLAPFHIPEVYVIIPPPEMEGQNVFNEYVVQSVFAKAEERNFIKSFLIRDQTDVDKTGGSRLWIDGSKSVYWSQNMQLYGPPPA